jgi:hypothetical protein
MKPCLSTWRQPAALLALACALGLPRAWSDEGGWKLAWSDDFERAELGTNWFARSGAARLANGRLFLSGAGATLLSEKAFAPDVKLEFVAEANPDLPPCDLSATLCANQLFGWDYLFAFGGNNNQFNQLLGGTAPVVDRKPSMLIEPGRKYRLTAVKEGRRLGYFVDGRQILEAEDSDPVGGPGFDRVGLVTWNGMFVDDVKVYERVAPAADGPKVLRVMPETGMRWMNRTLTCRMTEASIQQGIAAYNARRYREAVDRFAECTPPTLASVAGLAWVLGDLSFVERPGDQTKLVELATRCAQTQNQHAKDFVLAADWFRRVNIRSRDRRAVTRLVALGAENNPFYHKAALYRARYHYAAAREGADRVRLREALNLFGDLNTLWPDNLALREFAGERVGWGEPLIRPESDGPAWARHLQEAFARQHAILNWWFTERQSPDGQLGGGWGDDVEILRSWVPVACIASAGESALSGIERLADGVWQHALQEGYSPDIGDVEHSAEPSADALPTMLLLRYGDPLWVERNLQSARTIREKFMGLNPRGRLQFISAEFGTDGVNRHPRAGGDTGYHARAMRHFLWLAWWGVPEAQEVFLQWCDTWRDATMARLGAKPPGFAPASIFLTNGGIEPPDGRPWHDSAAHYYGFAGLPTMVHESFLAAFFLSRDRRYIEPVQAMLELATAGPLASRDPKLSPDHPQNLGSHVVHQATPDITAVYRWLTGERVYDEYTIRHPTPRQRFEVDGDLAKYEASFKPLAEALRYGWTQRTSEVLQTDRAGMEGATEVLGAYTGAVRDFRDAATPTLAVTWVTPDLNFAALVTEATLERLRMRLFNFNSTTNRIGLRPWRLVAGDYLLSAGEPIAGEISPQERYRWAAPREVKHRHRGAPIWLDLPPGRTWMVDLRLRGSTPRPGCLPDLALARRDVRVEDTEVCVTVHNLGSAPTPRCTVAIERGTGGGWQRVATTALEALLPIVKLQPATRTLRLPVSRSSLAGRFRVTVDADDQVDELCEMNNTVELPAPER